jgi:hypothetical protein
MNRRVSGEWWVVSGRDESVNGQEEHATQRSSLPLTTHHSLFLLLVFALAGLLVCAPGPGVLWAADEPGQADQPVRLKKKKRPGQEQPMAKPEKPEDPAPDPEEPKKPEEPAKPKDEERLDDKDDLKMPQEEPLDEQEILERIIRNTRASEERLANREVGEGTRQIQTDILKDIESLIEKSQQGQDDQNQAQNNQNQNQNDQDGQQNQGGQRNQGGKQNQGGQKAGNQRGGPGSASGGQTSRQRREARRRSRGGRQSASRGGRGAQQGNQTAQNNKPNEGRGNGNNPGGGGDSTTRGKENVSDRSIDLWGHLPEKDRALMNKEMEQKFMEKYEDLTRQYYRIIAEKSRRGR